MNPSAKKFFFFFNYFYYEHALICHLEVIIFYLVFLEKKQPNQIKKKTETEPKPVQTDRFRFGFLGQKSVQTSLALFWLGFFQFGSVFYQPGSVFFSVWFFWF
jgi:hypothetical protein